MVNSSLLCPLCGQIDTSYAYQHHKCVPPKPKEEFFPKERIDHAFEEWWDEYAASPEYHADDHTTHKAAWDAGYEEGIVEGVINPPLGED